jgi:hypothetical protein
LSTSGAPEIPSILPAPPAAGVPAVVSAPPCGISQLPAVTGPDALAFEGGEKSGGAVDVGGLIPAMAHALHRFEQLVHLAGGSVEVQSAYRPPAYQEHLLAVWTKWKELQRNTSPGCQALKARVRAEFSRHRLLESQKPATSSDHTRGLAFDAAVLLPYAARLKRLVSLDRLASLAGIKRPDIRRDPVHFKLASKAPAGPALADLAGVIPRRAIDQER